VLLNGIHRKHTIVSPPLFLLKLFPRKIFLLRKHIAATV